MTLNKPFRRNWRAMQAGPNSGYSDWAYIRDKDYSTNPISYIRSYILIQKDLEKIFEYIDPDDANKSTYSLRTHELLMRTCIEIEANFKAILDDNIFTPKKDKNGYDILNKSIYKKIDKTHHLSSYEAYLPIWGGGRKILTPFASWKTTGKSPAWYAAYNASKHSRQKEFKEANLDTLVTAVSGLLILISSQFKTEDFSAGADHHTISGYEYHDMSDAIGNLFRIKFPDDWGPQDQYNFDWTVLSTSPDKFDKIDYNKI